MLAGRYDIACKQGTDLEVSWAIKMPGGELQGLWGLSAHLGLKRYYSGVLSTFAQWSTSTGEITINPSTGVIDLVVSADDTAYLPSSGVYDLFLQVGTNGDALKILEGEFVLDKEVTR